MHYCGDVELNCCYYNVKVVSERYGIIRKLSIFFSLRTLLTSFVLFGVNAGTGPPGGGPAHAGGQAGARCEQSDKDKIGGNRRTVSMISPAGLLS